MLSRWSDRLWSVLSTQFRRGVLFLMAVGIATTVTSAVLTARPAAAAGGLLGGNSCAIETVGWVVCPTMRTIARLADKGFAYINQSTLAINYDLFNTKGTDRVFSAWQVMRNIANGMFVIVFMIIIYNYLLGKVGGSYSLKRLLPRLIIIAILVNISYYIGVIFVDIANIIGNAIWEIFKGIYGGGSKILPLNTSKSPYTDGNLTKMTAAAMGDSMYVWALMPILAAVNLTIAVISGAVVVLIVLRTAIITTLILASPVIIVLYLLPNFEKYSSQALRLFFQLLILFPIIALLLGVGQIVSMATGGWQQSNYVFGFAYSVTDLVSAAAAAVPLIAIWFIFKNMSSIMDSAGTRLSASIAGRRGGKDSEKAKVTGNATAGAAKNTGMSPFTRRQAFTRKRISSLAGSVLPKPSGKEKMPQSRQPESAMRASNTNSITPEDALMAQDRQVSNIDNSQLNDVLNNSLSDTTNNSASTTNNSNSSTENSLNNESSTTIQNNLAGAATKDKEKDEKQITAKDLFNNLNRAHESKDKDRKFNAGPAVTGSSGGSSAPAAPSAPTTNYSAPTMAQNGNIISGNSAPQPATVIAVPVQVDASSLLGGNSNMPGGAPMQPPVSGTEEKAKARAQKYLYDSQAEGDTTDNSDIFGNKKALTEQPHIPKNTDDKKAQDEKSQ